MSQLIYKYIKNFAIVLSVVVGYIFIPKLLRITCGFSVRNIHVVVDGRDVTRKVVGKNILNQLHKVYNSDTLHIKQGNILKMISAPKLKNIRVFKKYPDTIVVCASHKTPIAVLQKGGKYFYIDENGDTYHAAKSNKYHSIVITGDDSGLHVKQMIDLVSQNQFIAQNIIAASFIDKRRWDIYLFENGTKIMLPEAFLYSDTSIKILEDLEKLFCAIDKSKWGVISYIDCRSGDIAIGL